MLNNKLIKIVKILISIVVIISVFLIGYYLGDGIRAKKANSLINSQLVNKEEHSNKDELNREKVKSFLVAFYTKKDLGENRDRYKPFLTEGLYNAIVSNEEKASSQAYKGYIVDFEYEYSDIYINADTKEVIVNVAYKNTTLATKDDRSNATTKTHKETYKLTYTKSVDKILINKMDKITLEPYSERR